MTNLTVTEGSTGIFGGGIFNAGTLEVTNSTFSQNSAGGIRNDGTATLRNTIVANSPSGGNCSGMTPITDGRYNISSDASCNFTEPTSKNDTNPKFAPSGSTNR